jgi:transcriptional regulator GlxA family with amidase domain
MAEMSKTPRFQPTPRDVLIVLFPGFQLLDAAGPIAAFEIASRFRRGAYRVRLGAIGGGMVASSSGVSMPAEPLTLANVDTLVVVGGGGTRAAMDDAKLIAALKRAPKHVRRVTSVCSGAFLIAAAGLLNGKRATTHWRQAPVLAKMFPQVGVEPDCIHIKDGAVWTSAGVSAGIDLALAMIAEDLGENVATDVAREMVVYAKRPGGQAQHSALLELGAHDTRFGKLNAWMRDHLDDDLSVESLAAQAAMSPRNFARAYASETGVTPAKAVERLRADAARAALEQGGAIQDIARRTGFGDAERMRRAFVRLYGAPPASMRRTLRRA